MRAGAVMPLLRKIPGISLPLFSGILGGLRLFYTPGYLLAAEEKTGSELLSVLSGGNPDTGSFPALTLLQKARAAQAAYEEQLHPEPFEPFCLTLYLTLACNLNCAYCFAASSHDPLRRLTFSEIHDAAETVLRSCAAAGMPFTAVFHGGGEPTRDKRLPEIFEELRRMSAEAEVPFFSYIATNGVMSVETARFLAENFSTVGLSVDGPPDVQNRNRPLLQGGESAEIVARTAAILRRGKARLSARATVLPEDFSRIPEIAAYCGEELEIQEVHIEPVYSRDALQQISSEAAEAFCTGFLRAKAEHPEMRLLFSGSRIREIHGRYCNPFRHVLQRVPGGASSVCFLCSSDEEVLRDSSEDLCAKLRREDPACEDCFNRFHCARGCPDVCAAELPGARDAGSFRCLVSRCLAEAELMTLAETQLLPLARQYGYAGMEVK